jgi:hypothetical protein
LPSSARSTWVRSIRSTPSRTSAPVTASGFTATAPAGCSRPACRKLARAVPRIERADSLSFDAHKWLGVPNDCGVVLVRHGERLRRAFSIAAPYGGSVEDEGHALDYLEYGPQMSRSFRALKVSMVLRFFGTAGLLSAFLEEPGAGSASSRARPRAPRLRGASRADPLPLLLPFRAERPRGVPENSEVRAFIDRLNTEIAETIQKSGLALMMTTRIRGRVALGCRFAPTGRCKRTSTQRSKPSPASDAGSRVEVSMHPRNTRPSSRRQGGESVMLKESRYSHTRCLLRHFLGNVPSRDRVHR